MRRPRKPFVTEYKTPNRRSPAGFDAGLEAERPITRPLFDQFERGPDRGEEPLDAAMRAADALFSRIVPDEDDTESPSGSPRNLSDEGANGKPPGRILRALDEEPEAELAALEVERAPKRRGRKPGSKNKAKPPAPVHAESESYDEFLPASVPNAATLPLQFDKAKRPVAFAEEPVANAAETPTRTPWRRGKLKPWEGWKRRRLPPICW